jgi:hypothetical protein
LIILFRVQAWKARASLSLISNKLIKEKVITKQSERDGLNPESLLVSQEAMFHSSV